MAVIFTVVENNNKKNKLVHGMFTELGKAVDVAGNVAAKTNTVRIEERILDTKYDHVSSDPNRLYEGIVAVYDNTGKIIEDNRVQFVKSLGILR